MANWTLSQAKEALRLLAMTINKREGEYRVNFVNGREATAYYTDDIEDAIDTAFHMSQERRPSNV